MQAVTVDGQPRAVPAFIDNLAVVYNKDIFDAAGMDYPTDDWSWDDFMSAAAELNDPDAGIAGFGWPGTGDEDTTWRIWPMVWQGGGDIVSEDGESVGFDGPSGEQALAEVAKAADDGSVYIDSTAGAERMQQLFASGKMAMNIAGPYSLPEYVDAGVNYGVRRCPRSPMSTRRSPGPIPGRCSTTAPSARRRRSSSWTGSASPPSRLALDQRGGQPAADQRHQRRQGLREVRDEPAGPRQVHREHEARADAADRSRVPADLAGDGQGGRVGPLREGRSERGAERGGRDGEREAVPGP